MAAFCLPIPVASRGVAAVLGLGGHEGWDPALDEVWRGIRRLLPACGE